MFRIIKDGGSVGMTEAPTYIKQAENGCYVLCPNPESSGISLGNTVYHLAGREAIEGAETVALEHIDAGKEIELVNTTISDTDALTVDHEYRITLLELGIDDTEGDAETT